MIKYIKYPPAKRAKIILWGLLASYPFGGMTWQVLHHLAGLRQLGFDVWYVEDSDRLVLSPSTYCQTYDYSENIKFLSKQMESIGLGNRWIFRPPTFYDRCFGATDLQGLYQLYKEADAVLNLCGSHKLRKEHSGIRCLIYMETDPVANQVAVANGETNTIQELEAYDYLFTYGENLGNKDCLVPVERFRWFPTRPPVCTDFWLRSEGLTPTAPLSTIANWRHVGKDISWQGETYHWSKHYEFQRFINLPSHSKLPLELAIGAIRDDEVSQLRLHGWRIVPSVTLSDPSAYNKYICASTGEFTVAKDQYVRMRSGWFSDRSVCYIAAGRPVITQDTGFSNILPTGEGLFAYETEEEALASIEQVAVDYPRQSRAAYEIAREFFSAEKILGDVMRQSSLM